MKETHPATGSRDVGILKHNKYKENRDTLTILLNTKDSENKC